MNNKDEILVDSEDYIYGTIYSTGGVKPSIRLKTTNGERIKIQATKEDIKSFFSKFLYEECGMLVEFKEDLFSHTSPIRTYCSSKLYALANGVKLGNPFFIN